VPLSKKDEQQAVYALMTTIAQWWREHGHGTGIHRRADPASTIMTEPADAQPRPPHLVPELEKRGSYPATFGPPEK
jgi:hypothetical protein